VPKPGRDGESWKDEQILPTPPAGAVRDYLVAIGIAIDKFRLENAESTDRHHGSGKLIMDLRSMDSTQLDDQFRMLMSLMTPNPN
jgi:hypothetical protein